MKWLLNCFPGHLLQLLLTDVTIGAYTLATAMAVLEARRQRGEHGDCLVAGAGRGADRDGPDRAHRVR